MKTKLIALLTVIAISLSLLASCGKTEKKMAKADEAFRTNPYIINIGLDFSSSDENIAGVLDQFKKTVTTVYVLGDEFMATKSEEIVVEGDVHIFNTVYTVTGGTLYREISRTENGFPRTGAKNYAKIGLAESRALISHVCYVGGVSADGFGASEVEKTDKKTVTAKYTAPSDAVRSSLSTFIVALFENSLDNAETKDATLTVVLKNNRYSSAVVDCVFDITVDGKVYTIGATVRLDFTEGDFTEISAPADASEYKKALIDGLLPYGK